MNSFNHFFLMIALQLQSLHGTVIYVAIDNHT